MSNSRGGSLAWSSLDPRCAQLRSAIVSETLHGTRKKQRSSLHKGSTRRLLTPKGPVAVALLIAGIMAVYFPYYSQAFFFTGDARTRSVVRVTAAEVHAMQSTGVLIPFGLSMSSTQLRVMNERATSGDDFLPRDIKEKPSQPPTEMVQAKGGRVIEAARLHQNYYRSQVEMLAAGKAELLQFWFPGWQASVDGTPVKTGPSGSQAIVSCNLPAGDHVVEFIYRDPPHRNVGIVFRLSLPLSAPAPLSFFDSADTNTKRFGIAEREASELIEFPSRIPTARLSSCLKERPHRKGRSGRCWISFP
jgi:hypothetical protein